MALTIDRKAAASHRGARSSPARPRRESARGVAIQVSTFPRIVDVVDNEASEELPGLDHADAFECRWPSELAADAMTVAKAFLWPSLWRRIVAGRNLLVAPFCVRPARQGDASPFPIHAPGPDRVACGVDDRHPFAVVRPVHRRLITPLMPRQHHPHTAEAGAS